jgi:hypothetical protein
MERKLWKESYGTSDVYFIFSTSFFLSITHTKKN